MIAQITMKANIIAESLKMPSYWQSVVLTIVDVKNFSWRNDQHKLSGLLKQHPIVQGWFCFTKSVKAFGSFEELNNLLKTEGAIRYGECCWLDNSIHIHGVDTNTIRFVHYREENNNTGDTYLVESVDLLSTLPALKKIQYKVYWHFVEDRGRVNPVCYRFVGFTGEINSG